jgi:hypothetical protein
LKPIPFSPPLPCPLPDLYEGNEDENEGEGDFESDGEGEALGLPLLLLDGLDCDNALE